MPSSMPTKTPKSVMLRTSPRDVRADRVLLLDQRPRVRLDLLHAERDLAVALVDVEHHGLDHVAHVDQLRRVLDALGPRHLGDVDQALDAGLELDERAVVGERDHLAADALADRVAHRRVAPRIGLDLLQAQRDALGLRVEAQHLHLDLVADLEQLARVVDPAPGHVGDVQQAVDAAEVDERAVVGDVLDHAVDDLALLEALERRRAQRSRSFSRSARRESTMLPRRLLNLMILNLSLSPISAFEVAHRAQVDLRAGQERLHADVDGEAALHAREDHALDGLVGLVGLADVVPDLEPVGLLLGEHDAAVFVLGLLDQDVDHVADVTSRCASLVHELPAVDQAFGLEADVHLDVVVVHGEDAAVDDLALLDLAAFALEEVGEALAARLGLLRHEETITPGCRRSRRRNFRLGPRIGRFVRERASASRAPRGSVPRPRRPRPRWRGRARPARPRLAAERARQRLALVARISAQSSGSLAGDAREVAEARALEREGAAPERPASARA